MIASIMRPEGETGVQTHFRVFSQWLKGQGEETVLVTPFDASRWKIYPVFGVRRLIDRINKPSSVFWYRYWHGFFLRKVLRQKLSRNVNTVVYSQCPVSSDAALRARSKSGQKVAMVVHFNISQADEWVGKGMLSGDGKYYEVIRDFEARVLPKLDGLVFVSEFMRRQVALRIPAVAKVPQCVIPNFVADPGYSAETRIFQADLICIGTLEARKNQQFAIRLVAASAKLGVPLTLTIVGDGPDRAMLQNLAQQLQVAHLVHFAGYVSHAIELIRNHKACIHTAHIENLPITLIESLSQGRPVFAPAVGGIPEVFSDGIEGRFISLNNVEESAQVVISSLSSGEWMRQSSLAARQRFLRDFELNTVASRLRQFLVGLAK